MHNNAPDEPGYGAYLRGFASLLPPPRPGATALDFGSGPEPALAAMLRALGYDTTAYDPFFAPGAGWRDRHFDLITVHEVAEHLKYPGRTLGALSRRLAPGGLLAIRTRFLPPDREAFSRWWYREDPTHLGFFSEASFRAFAVASGLGLELLEPPDTAFLARHQRAV